MVVWNISTLARLNYPTLGFAPRISMIALSSWWHEFSLVECEADSQSLEVFDYDQEKHAVAVVQ